MAKSFLTSNLTHLQSKASCIIPNCCLHLCQCCRVYQDKA